MKSKIFISSLIIFSIFIIISSCSEDKKNPTEPFEPPVYENGEDKIGNLGGIIKVTYPSSEISGAYTNNPEGH